jgi:hypothetical protein
MRNSLLLVGLATALLTLSACTSEVDDPPAPQPAPHDEPATGRVEQKLQSNPMYADSEVMNNPLYVGADTSADNPLYH